MADQVQLIVSCLNGPPFDMNLRLIDFDEKERKERLQILIDVLLSIDDENNYMPLQKKQYDYYFDGNKLGINEILSLLSVIRYKGIPSQDEEQVLVWTDRVCAGEKKAIYSILEFCLVNFDKVKKRVYLSPFLTPIQLPLDICMTQTDDVLSNIASNYQSLQDEFKEVHMIYEDMKRNQMGGSDEIRHEIQSLQEEKIQLLQQVDILNEKTKNDALLLRILNATTTLRKEEEQEMILMDRVKDQQDALNTLQTNQTQFERQYQSLKSISLDDNGSPEMIVLEIQKHLTHATLRVRSDLANEQRKIQNKIHEYEAYDEKKFATEDDLDSISEKVKGFEDEIEQKRKKLYQEQANPNYAKISVYKQHVNVAEKKLKGKESSFKMKADQLCVLQEEVNTIRDKEISIKEDSSLDDELRVKVEEQKSLEKQLEQLQDESQSFQNDVDELKRRQRFLENERYADEQNADAKGFHKAQKTLQDTIENDNEVNELKGDTLEEISGMVTKITDKLKVERERLQPMIMELKHTRKEYAVVSDTHQVVKRRYDKLSMRLAAGRHQLEQECEELQEEWLQEERNYHYLTNVVEIEEANLETVQQEINWKNGIEKMLPDFQCLHDLYQNKLTQQENLAKQLRIDQKRLNENQTDNLKQREMFSHLKRILELKSKLKTGEGDNLRLSEENSVIGEEMKLVETLGF